MDNILACTICSIEYKRDSVIPQVLDCGHTFCSGCIKQLETNPSCPICQSNIQSKSPWKFPINYSLLSLIEESQSVYRIKKLKEKYFIRKDFLNKVKCEISENLNIIDEKLQNLESLEDCNANAGKEVTKLLHEMEKEYQKFPPNILLHFEELDHFASFSKNNGTTTKELMCELYKALQKGKVYAFKRVEKKLKFGELTIRDNKILIHSLTLDDIPEGSKTVPFEDMKDRFPWNYAFLTIRGKLSTSLLIQIRIVGANRLPLFIKLCTGEKSHAYKSGHFSKKGRDITKLDLWYDEQTSSLNSDDSTVVMKFIFTIIFPHALPNYYINAPKIMSCEKGSIIVTEEDEIQLMEVIVPGKYRQLGIVDFPSRSSDILRHIGGRNKYTCQILDCGVMVDLSSTFI